MFIGDGFLKKLYYLEGIRGIAAFIVVLAHFVQVFYISLFSLDPTTMHSRFESTIAATPFNIFYNGNFAVCIFFVLSGYVLSYKFFVKKDKEILVESAVKRYFRLAVPVITSLLFAYAILKMNGYFYGDIVSTTRSTMPDYYSESISFLQILKEGLYGVFIQSIPSLNPVLWTMYYELFGSLLVFSFLALFGNLKNRSIVYIILFIYFWNTYFLAFILGMLLCDAVIAINGKLPKIFKNKIVITIVTILGLFLGSFPYVNTSNTIYEFLIINPNLNIDYFMMYHIFGAVLLLTGVIGSDVLQKLLSINIFRFLGNISFSLYLVHFTILCSFSSFVFNKFLSAGFSYNFSFILTLIPSLILIFILSYFMFKFVDSKSVSFSKWMYDKFFRNEKIH